MSYRDLSDLRAKLDRMSERVVVRFKERSDYKLNEPVYQSDPLKKIDNRVISLFEFSLEGIEKYHASLGRYKYPDQHPLVNKRRNLPHSKVEREVSMEKLPKFEINLKDRIIPQYLIFVKSLCEPGEDPSTYGETVYCDADLIQLINERINIGRYVAATKLKKDSSLGSIIENIDKLKEKLTNITREREVVDNFRSLANKHSLSQDFGEDYAMWMIQTTIGVEVKYIQEFVKRFGSGALQKYKESDQNKNTDGKNNQTNNPGNST